MSIIRSGAFVAAIALTSLPHLQVEAQDATPPAPLAVGQTIQARLVAADPAMTERGRFRVYQLRLEPGRRYVAWMNSDDFDAYLSLHRPVGGITDVLREDDDGGEGLNSRMVFRVPEAGSYLLVAQALLADATGRFEVGLDTLAPRPVRTLTIGETVTLTLTAGDQTDTEYGQAYEQRFVFDAPAGLRLGAVLDDAGSSASATFGTMVGDEFVPHEGQGEGFGRAVVTTRTSGRHAVAVFSWEPTTLTLRVEERAPPAPPAALRRGAAVAGILTMDAAETDDGRRADVYSFRARAGERLTITMESEEFDTYLILGRMDGGDFEELVRNDDGDEEEDGLNARIVHTVPADGEYVLQATSFSGNSEGAYTLRVAP
jgi:hypothetical protein